MVRQGNQTKETGKKKGVRRVTGQILRGNRKCKMKKR